MKQATIFFLTGLMTLVFCVSKVSADQYGGGGGGGSETPREEVNHGTVNTGIGDNLLVLAALVGGGALAFIIIAKLTRRVYLLD